MAEPVYPSLEEEPKPIGFEALAQDTERQKVDDKRIKKAGSEQSEEIRLLTSEEQRGQVSQTALLAKISQCVYIKFKGGFCS